MPNLFQSLWVGIGSRFGFFLRGCSLGLLLGGQIAAWAQHPHHYNLSENEGLPSSRVYSLAVDSLGFVWAGTEYGLARWDGQRFVSFGHPGLRSQSLDQLIVRPDGTLTAATFTGQILHVPPAGVWNPFPVPVLDTTAERLLMGRRPWLRQAPDGTLALRFANHLLTLPPEGHNWQTMPMPNIPFSPYGETDVWYDDQGGLYTFPWGKFQVLKQTRLGWEHDHKLNQLLGQRSMVLIEFAHLNSTKPWIIERHSLRGICPTGPGQQYEWVNLQERLDSTLRGVWLDVRNGPAGTFWILTTQGVYWVDSAWRNKLPVPCLFPGLSITDVAQDLEGQWYFSSLQQGVWVVPSLENWVFEAPNATGPTGITRLRLGPNRQLLAGTSNGNLWLLGRSGAPRTLQLPNIQPVEAILWDSLDASIWVHCGEILELDAHTARLKYETKRAAQQMGLLPNGDVLTISGNSLFRWAKPAVAAAPLFQKTPYIELEEAGKPTRKIWSYSQERSRDLLVDSKGGLWQALANGLSYLDPNGTVHSLIDPQTLRPFAAQVLCLGLNERVWVGLAGGRILAIDPMPNGGWRFRVWGTEAGLRGSAITALAVSPDGALWVGTNAGLGKLRPNESKLVWIRQAGGLLSDQVQALAVFDQRLWVGTQQGLQAFPLSWPTPNSHPPYLLLRNLVAGNEQMGLDSVLTLPYDRAQLQIEFLGLALRGRGPALYEYRQAGPASPWVQLPEGSSTLSLSGLAPGTHQLEFRIRNESGILSQHPLQLSLHILPPWWQTKSFYFLSALLGAVLLGWAFRWRIRQVQRQGRQALTTARLKHELRALRLMALRSQMNPHFVFNALNSIQSIFLQQNVPLANAYLTKFSTLMRLYLDHSHQNTISLGEELESLRLYLDLESLRFGDSFWYDMQVSDDLALDQFDIPPLLIQPFVENALKHGLLHRPTDRRLWLRFEPGSTPNSLRITIRDNGVGRQAAARLRKSEHTPFGSTAAQQRIDLLNSQKPAAASVRITDLIDNQGQPAGTEVELIFVDESAPPPAQPQTPQTPKS